ncbi:MAG: hypothetical protein LBK82_06680 [Planctomycetaceae bacterium]|nr:hypothetical protein [Planctomycetaceae bacterium]
MPTVSESDCRLESGALSDLPTRPFSERSPTLDCLPDDWRFPVLRLHGGIPIQVLRT